MAYRPVEVGDYVKVCETSSSLCGRIVMVADVYPNSVFVASDIDGVGFLIRTTGVKIAHAPHLMIFDGKRDEAAWIARKNVNYSNPQPEPEEEEDEPCWECSCCRYHIRSFT